MAELNIFQGDAFSTQELTASINMMPETSQRVSNIKLFTRVPLTNEFAQIESKENHLSLVPIAARGTMPNVGSGPKRRTRIFKVPYIPQNRTIYASEVSGIRSFGSETEEETVAEKVAEKIAAIKTDIDATLEWHRVGAITGHLRDVNAAFDTIYNLFTEFGITRTEVDFNLDDPEFDVKAACKSVKRSMRAALGQSTFVKTYALVGNTFFDKLINHPKVRESFTVDGNGDWFRQIQGSLGGDDDAQVELFGITWMNYEISIGDADFVDTNEANFFPGGVADLFLEFNSPPEWMETVNTPGQPYYAKQRVLDWDVGVEVHGNTSTLPICSRPKCLILGTYVPAEEEE